MSHDQRPGKMRVVGSGTAQRRRGDVTTIEAVADVVAAPAASDAASASASSAGLPLVPALIFLLACIAGGVAVALFAPLGNG